MEEIRSAMADHQRVWNEVYAKQAQLKRKDNTEAYAEARPHWERLHRAWERLASLLPSFEPGSSPEATYAWIQVCEIDVPAFRIGYLKEQIYRKFKKAPLNEEHRQRILALALHHLQACQWRRELRTLSPLAVSLADTDFLREVEALWSSDLQEIDRYKIGLFFSALLQRKDLAAQSEVDRHQVLSIVETLRTWHRKALAEAQEERRRLRRG
jgi:hypothetical protein